MKRSLALVVGTVFVLFLLAGCSSTTPNTEGQTLAQAQQDLSDAGVQEDDITVTGESGDPNSLYVCNQTPDGVDPSTPVTLEVAANCPAGAGEEEEDDDDRKRKKRSGGGGRRR